ncbi:MAG: hypothetical protein F6K56_41685 [Moorea sp. SIO3G5]|nr:hypothetical protein [Moorena sp. SIO3G5]
MERASGCGTGIWLWNGHLVVEWASGCGMGILRGTGILPVSSNWQDASFNIFPRGQDAHPNHILFHLFPTPDSRFPILNS